MPPSEIGGAIAVEREGGATRRRRLSDIRADGVKESRRRYRRSPDGRLSWRAKRAEAMPQSDDP
jgi:hypothetical protein